VQASGDFSKARAGWIKAAQELARDPADATDDFVISALIGQAIYERHFDSAISVVERKLNSLPAGQPPDSIVEFALVQRGFCQQWMGRDEEARRSFLAPSKRLSQA